MHRDVEVREEVVRNKREEGCVGGGWHSTCAFPRLQVAVLIFEPLGLMLYALRSVGGARSRFVAVVLLLCEKIVGEALKERGLLAYSTRTSRGNGWIVVILGRRLRLARCGWLLQLVVSSQTERFENRLVARDVVEALLLVGGKDHGFFSN